MWKALSFQAWCFELVRKHKSAEMTKPVRACFSSRTPPLSGSPKNAKRSRQPCHPQPILADSWKRIAEEREAFEATLPPIQLIVISWKRIAKEREAFEATLPPIQLIVISWKRIAEEHEAFEATLPPQADFSRFLEEDRQRTRSVRDNPATHSAYCYFLEEDRRRRRSVRGNPATLTRQDKLELFRFVLFFSLEPTSLNYISLATSLIRLVRNLPAGEGYLLLDPGA